MNTLFELLIGLIIFAGVSLGGLCLINPSKKFCKKKIYDPKDLKK
jgi:hypothetical protein